MKALVGYTGFVGSNIYAAGDFDAVYNSKNIEDAYGTRPDLLVYAGLRAEKYLANHAPEQDMELIRQAEYNIEKIEPKKLVLISTVDVLKDPQGADENAVIDTEDLHAYGYNRYQLECWVRKHYPESLIIRLPGLFGINIKKNFIYDYINVIPFMLKKEKFEELSKQDCDLKNYYQLQENGFYKVNVTEKDRETLKQKFRKLGFSALNFTDSRNVYQFYNLAHLWKDIQIVMKAGVTLWHPATEPVSAAEVYYYLTGETFCNELSGTPVKYDFHTKYADLFGKQGAYVYTKEEVLKEIKEFTEGIDK